MIFLQFEQLLRQAGFFVDRGLVGRLVQPGCHSIGVRHAGSLADLPTELILVALYDLLQASRS